MSSGLWWLICGLVIVNAICLGIILRILVQEFIRARDKRKTRETAQQALRDPSVSPTTYVEDMVCDPEVLQVLDASQSEDSEPIDVDVPIEVDIPMEVSIPVEMGDW